MMNWETCECGRQLPADEMKKHRPGGICLKKINRSVKGSLVNRVVSGAELADRSVSGEVK